MTQLDYSNDYFIVAGSSIFAIKTVGSGSFSRMSLIDLLLLLVVTMKTLVDIKIKPDGG